MILLLLLLLLLPLPAASTADTAILLVITTTAGKTSQYNCYYYHCTTISGTRSTNTTVLRFLLLGLNRVACSCYGTPAGGCIVGQWELTPALSVLCGQFIMQCLAQLLRNTVYSWKQTKQAHPSFVISIILFSFTRTSKLRLVPVFNYVPRHEDVGEGGNEASLFLNLVLDERKWSISHSGRFTPGAKEPVVID